MGGWVDGWDDGGGGGGGETWQDLACFRKLRRFSKR